MAFDKSKFLRRFIEEAGDHITQLNNGLLSLEKNPDDTDILNAIFRSAHTIKGSSRMMKFSVISELAHKLEDAFDALRQNRVQLSKTFSDILFQGIDTIESMLNDVSSGKEVSELPEDICNMLENAARGNIEKPSLSQKESEQSSSPLIKTKTVVAKPIDSELKKSSDQDLKTEIEPQKKVYDTIRISENKLDELIKLIGEVMSGHMRLKHRVVDIHEAVKLSKSNMAQVELININDHLPDDTKAEINHSTLSLLDRLKKVESNIKEDLNIGELLTAELQDRSLKMRMLPISTIFDTFHRTIRDISKSSGKNIDFEVSGAETELDKKIIEKLGDPLIHMIRNSIDHGIESPEQRQKAGKPTTGKIKLSAGYKGCKRLIKVIDDGAGIPLSRLKEKAINKKMFSPEELEVLPESEIINLIFHPGFSTADMITDISGRGVGMDVVKKNISDELKGSIRIKTKAGQGTTFFINLPLTMAIINILVISVSEMIYAVHSNYIKEILRIPQEDIIDVVDKKALRLREQIIPVIFLCDVLGLPRSDQYDDNGYLILIVSIGEENMGLIVDSLIESESRTIKPLPQLLKNNRWISGITISGNNKINCVLHLPNIIKSAKEIKTKKESHAPSATDKKKRHILVVDDSISTREIEKSILESYGYSVSLASDGMEALENTKNFKYDLIVTDIEMPHMDGFTLTKNLKMDEEYKNTPIILVSSLDKSEDKRMGLQVGADAYIVKGDFDQTNLLDTIQNLLG